MALLVPTSTPPYAEPVGKAAARQGNGPWGDAIRYWLKEMHLTQMHLVEGTGIPGNTISKATRGLDVHMNTLRRIADFLEVPFTSILVSPTQRLSPTEERYVAEQVAASASKIISQNRAKAPVAVRVDPRVLGIAKRYSALPVAMQKTILRVLGELERQKKKKDKEEHMKRVAAGRLRASPKKF